LRASLTPQVFLFDSPNQETYGELKIVKMLHETNEITSTLSELNLFMIV